MTKFDAVFSGPDQSDEAAKFGDPITIQGLAANSPKSLVTVVRAIGQHSKPEERVLLVTSGGGLKLIDGWLKDGSPQDMKRDVRTVAQKGFTAGKLYKISQNGLQVGSDEQPGQYCMAAPAKV